jgi:RNA polymerase sigma factor (TIGR02999 family)
MTDTSDITELLSALHGGQEDVVSQLLPRIRAELRRIAALQFRRERAGQPFDASDLVQDVSLRLLHPGSGPWNNREHFFAIAAINIRRRLIEHARATGARKRGGNWIRVELDDLFPAQPESWGELLDVDEALCRLADRNERQSRVVELRVFGGMTTNETAVALGISPSTVKEDWIVATAFLRRELRAYCDTAAMGTD